MAFDSGPHSDERLLAMNMRKLNELSGGDHD
jgi:hypothetical protein